MEPNASLAMNSAEPKDAAAMSPRQAAGRRFLYAGGTRPLDGYTLKRGVGQGGFGEIYYAVSDSGKEVALKLIRRNLDVELRGIRQCLNLKHPNLLNLFDIRQDDNGDTWVVMEFVAGLSLQDAIDAQPNGMPLDEALAWIHGIAAATAYLHDHGIVHRDLKPANIFSDDGVVKVGDYGLSKFISCSRRSGHTESIGTVHYMAPEVANGRYGKEIDVYALGIILYEMLTGNVPFDGESVGEVLMKHLTGQPDVSVLPEPYREIVSKAMEKDPEKRYPSAVEFLAALPPPESALPGTNRLPLGSRGPKEEIKLPPREERATPQPIHLGETIVAATVVDEEPILAAVRANWQKIVDQWNQSNLNPTLKILILIGIGLVLVLSVHVWVFPFIFLLICYGVYRVIRWVVTPMNRPSPTNETASAAAPPELAKTVAAPSPDAVRMPEARRSVRDRKRGRKEEALAALVLGTPRERLRDLLGSLLLSSLVVGVLTVVMGFVISFNGEPTLEQMVWLFSIGVAGSWAVLVPAKIWEGTKGDTTLRRFLMMVLGMGLGAIACFSANYFHANLSSSPQDVVFETPVPPNFYAADRPLLPVYVIAFTALFFVIRWWLQADPLRSTRLSVFSLVVTLVFAFVISGLLHFPQPWLTIIAALVSIAVQISSPWVHPRERKAARRG
jgi:serine/threonine protein kinase